MFDFFFDVPLFVAGPAIIVSLCLVALGGLVLVRRHILPHLRIHHEDSHFIGTMVHTVMVFYGLAAALIAVNVFETYAEVARIVSREATQLAAMYRDTSTYPEPTRSELQKALRDYTENVIHVAWPLQRRGEIPSDGVGLMYRFQTILTTYEPDTDPQEILHAEALRAYNDLIVARNLRLDAVGMGLPSVMWIVILLGAVISLSAALFFKVEDVRLHGILVALLAMFIGLIIFMTLTLDQPFRGDLGVTPEPYELIYDKLMKL